MKQLYVILIALTLVVTAVAQTSATAPTTGASAPLTEPASTTKADNTRYLNNPDLLTSCAAEVAKFNDKPCDIIFIGDSITARWLSVGKDIWDRTYVPRHALDFGVEGDKTQNVLWRLNNMEVQNLKPKVAVVMIGTENRDNTPHEIADGIKAVVTNTEATFPGVKIILVSLLPNERAGDKTMQVNSLIKGYGDGESVFFLDLVPLMPEAVTTAQDGTTDTNWKGLGKDHLHPDATGYQIWADAMEPLLKRLLAQ